MSHDYGPLRTYEVTWRSRPPEVVQGHSVQFDSSGIGFSLMGIPAPPRSPRFRIYGQFGENWRLVLMGLEEDASCIRDVTEQMQALEAMASTDAEETP